MHLTRVFSGLLLLLCVATVFQADEANAGYELSFTTQLSNGVPVRSTLHEFNCTDQIYSVITASDLDAEPVKAIIIWRNPSGEIQEQTPVSLYPVQGKAFGWAWLKLHRAAGAAMLSFIDDSLGMDEFIGDWHIELRISNQQVASGTFNVLC